MNYGKLLSPFALVLGLVGCGPFSIQPFYTPKDLVQDPSLVGVWQEAGDDTTVWTISRGAAASYEASTTEAGNAQRFRLHLLQLGGVRYLDVVPREEEGSLWHIPEHSLYRIRITADGIALEPLNEGYFESLIKNQKAPMAQIVEEPGADGVDKLIVLTGSTAELQQFVLQHAKERGLFDDAVRYKRVR